MYAKKLVMFSRNKTRTVEALDQVRSIALSDLLFIKPRCSIGHSCHRFFRDSPVTARRLILAYNDTAALFTVHGIVEKTL